MKVWKLTAGIISIVLSVVIGFQSCAAGVVNTLEKNGGSSGTVGFFCGILILAGGIISVATRNVGRDGGNIALIVVFALAAFIGLAGYGNYKDLVVWSVWAIINVILAIVCMVMNINSTD